MAARSKGMEQRSVIERLARHLAGDQPDDWRDHAADAASILAILKEPDAAMREAGDGGVWSAMIDAALRERWADAPASGSGDAPPHGTDEEGDMALTQDAVGHDRADWVHLHKDRGTDE